MSWLRVHGLLIATSVLLAACSPRLYQRETLKLDHSDFEQFAIRYEAFDGCLLKRDVPVSYRLQRPQYLMTLDVRFGNDRDPASLDLSLTGTGGLRALFADPSAALPGAEIEDGVRYHVDTGTVRNGSVVLHVLRDDEELGVETIRIERESCRALSLGGDAQPG